MNHMNWWRRGLGGAGLAVLAVVGCQTYVPTTGQTLPSGHYLEHPPQYIPQSPPFPLSRELANLERAAAAAEAGRMGAANPLPPPVPVPERRDEGVAPLAPPPER